MARQQGWFALILALAFSAGAVCVNFPLQLGLDLRGGSQLTLEVQPAGEIKTIDAEEAYQMVQNKNCNLIDIRESNELENTGSVEGASHIPRGMLEVYLDPNSPIFQNGQIDQNKEFVLFCAGGVRSALAVKSLKDMGYQKVSHIDGGFGTIASSKFKII